MEEPPGGWPVAHVDDDWLTRSWRALRWALYAALLLVGAWFVLLVFAVQAGS